MWCGVTLQVSAALSYYFVLSVFPSLIFLSGVLGFVLLPLTGHVPLLMDRLRLGDTMQVVYSVLDDLLSSHCATGLSFGMLEPSGWSLPLSTP